MVGLVHDHGHPRREPIVAAGICKAMGLTHRVYSEKHGEKWWVWLK